jgi:MinD superfamily P-loop ATPase
MGNSGKLVSRLKTLAREEARNREAKLILIDGPPGIGCPVISSLGGVSYAVAVTEPTPSGIHDLDRLLRLVEHFRIPAGVVVNKSDLRPDVSRSVREKIRSRGHDDLGEIPFDPAVPENLSRGMIPVEADTPFAGEARRIWNTIGRRMAEIERSVQHEYTVREEK